MKFKQYLRSGLLLALSTVQPVMAEMFMLPAANNDLIGEIRYAQAAHEDTLIDIARRYSVGQDEIVMANPKVDRWLPGTGTQVLIPRQFVLPEAVRNGIVINIPEMRLFYYPSQGKNKPSSVITYPISIGRMDWRTPLGTTRVIQKVKDPTWTPPESIKIEHARDGDFLPDVMPAGPMNPLGRFALKLGVSGYLIHGTGIDKAYGIGMRVTHGCIRMYPEDIEKLFGQVEVGTSVTLVNQPVKMGWSGETLYVEVHQPLDEDVMTYAQLLDHAMNLFTQKTAGKSVTLDGAALRAALERPSGVPIVISRKPQLSPPVTQSDIEVEPPMPESGPPL